MLDHFVNLGIETIWLSPYFKSPMRDMGYDVSNFVDIDPKFGTIEDFDELIRQMKKRGNLLVAILVLAILNSKKDDYSLKIRKVFLPYN